MPAALASGVDYTFFCSYPGHATLMHGRLVLGAKSKLADNR
jgi:azurin